MLSISCFSMVMNSGDFHACSALLSRNIYVRNIIFLMQPGISRQSTESVTIWTRIRDAAEATRHQIFDSLSCSLVPEAKLNQQSSTQLDNVVQKITMIFDSGLVS